MSCLPVCAAPSRGTMRAATSGRSMSCPKRCWFAIAALLWCGCAAALSPDRTIKELHHTAWGPGQGAPLGGALGLAQTNDGYLWIAGPSGLFRFDGIAFERLELPHDPKPSSLSLIS